MTSHHAVLIHTEQPLSFDLDTVPNLIYREQQLGIDAVRSLIQAAYRRPEGDSVEQHIMVATEFITEEAQQALLKIIEEPPVSTKFVFVLPGGYTLLPTLESRFERSVSTEEVAENHEVFSIFLNSSYAERLEAIEEALKKKDQVWQAGMKRGLIAYLKAHSQADSLHTLKDLESVARLLLTRGASNKFLFEQMALTLPV